jgi:hypothetical protein
MLTSHQFSLVVGAKVPRSWAGVRFWRSLGAGCYCLWGFPVAGSAQAIERLQVLGCVVERAGECSTAPGFRWVTFQATPAAAAKLALWFPAPSGATPLLVTGKGTLGKRRGARVLVQSVA